MDELQSWWQVPAITYFCSVFQEVFDLVHFDIDELEVALLETNHSVTSPLIADLLVRLLRGCYQRTDIVAENYEWFLHDIVKYRWHLEDKCRKLLQSDAQTFGSLSLRDRVDVLLAICHYRLTADDVDILLENVDADSLRLQPLGHDCIGANYWYFYGTRLYKENVVSGCGPTLVQKGCAGRRRRQVLPVADVPFQSFTCLRNRTRTQTRYTILKQKKNNQKDKRQNNCSTQPDGNSRQHGTLRKPVCRKSSKWHVVCSTYADWNLLVEKFASSETKCERDLAKLLACNFLPTVKELFDEQRKANSKKNCRRSSRIRTEQHSDVDDLPKSSIQDMDAKSEHWDVRRYIMSLEIDDKKLEQQQERERLREERARRAQEREKRASLVAGMDTNCLSLSGQLSVILLSFRGRLSASQLAILATVLELVKQHKSAWPFIDAVDEQFAPNYYDIIKQPIDLSTMETKLKEEKYTNITSLVEDFQLMVSNCRTYNGFDSEYTRMAVRLQSYFSKLIVQNAQQLQDLNNAEDAIVFITNSAADNPQEPHDVGSLKVNSTSCVTSECERDLVMDQPVIGLEELPNDKIGPFGLNSCDTVSSLQNTADYVTSLASPDSVASSHCSEDTLLSAASDVSISDDDTTEYSPGLINSPGTTALPCGKSSSPHGTNLQQKSSDHSDQLEEVDHVKTSSSTTVDIVTADQKCPSFTKLSVCQSVSDRCIGSERYDCTGRISSSSLNTSVNGVHNTSVMVGEDCEQKCHTAATASRIAVEAPQSRPGSIANRPSASQHVKLSAVTNHRRQLSPPPPLLNCGTLRPPASVMDHPNPVFCRMPTAVHHKIRTGLVSERVHQSASCIQLDPQYGVQRHALSFWRPANEAAVVIQPTITSGVMELLSHDRSAPAVISHVAAFHFGNGLPGDRRRLNFSNNRMSHDNDVSVVVPPVSGVNGVAALPDRIPGRLERGSSLSRVSNHSRCGLHVLHSSVSSGKMPGRASLSNDDLCGSSLSAADGIPQVRTYMMSPHVLDSPRSLSPIITSPYCSTISPQPRMQRLSISIPDSPPAGDAHSRQQSLGEGLLTTKPNLVLMAPPLVNCYSGLPAPVLGPSALQWQCAQIVRFGPRIPFV